MDLLNDRVKPMYFKYLSAAFGSALISSIYGVVDMAMVGQYQGPDGTAALAVVSPIWNIIYSLGLLMGIGGSVMFSTLRGESGDNRKKSNQYFTAALLGVGVLAAASWLAVIFLDDPLLRLFGAEETLLPLAKRYLFPVKFVVPSFLMTQLMAAFLRNDGNPALATKSVLFGGIFNVFGDYFFVFVLKLGIMGAGLATAMGSVFSLLLMLTHFRSKKNTIRLEKPERLLPMLKTISVTGFSTFFIDVAMGILTMLFNRQILRYLGTDALSVYGVIINISTFVQCCAYSIGQAAQPIISTNFGAKRGDRIAEILKYAIGTAAVFGLIWTTLAVCVPNLFIRIFMTPTPQILEAAPSIIRSYGISFLLLPLNIFPIHIGRSFYPSVPVVMQQTNSIFLEESKFLREMAEQSDCVIVGRCADVVLREYQPLRIFVYADMESKLGRCRAKAPEHEKMTAGELKKHILSIDKDRAHYYEYFTGRTWGDRMNYDLCVNTTNASVKELAHVLSKLY